MSGPSQRLQRLVPNEAANVEYNGKLYNTFTEPPVAMAEERAKTSFPVREVTNFLDGGEEKTREIEGIMTMIERDPVFRNEDFYDLTKAELRELAVKRVAAINEYVASAANERDIQQRLALIGLSDPGSYTRAGVHFGLFLAGIRGGGTSEQLFYWVRQGAGNLRKFFGCFGMTELGHGSNVAGLETTATFDERTDEFIVNTPHVGATKWWIGGAAHTATHCLVYARLIVKGKDYGVKQFVVQLRSTDDWTIKQGVSLGDIGKKMGRDQIDNGWIQFTNVRIPRQFMLQKYTKIDAAGNVTQPPLAQLSYGALVGGRVSMVAGSHQTAKRFITIATRYAAIRRQFASSEDQPETKILDYTYHQRRLMPRLAYAYAMKAGSDILYDVYYAALNKLDSVDRNNKAEMDSAIEDMKELFGLSAGLKAFSTWGALEIIDQSRQACGGHGYSGYNGFGQGYNDWAVECTWEGDNNILTLSTGRSLIQSGLALRKGKRVGAAVQYLTRAKELASSRLNGRDIRDPKVMVEAWEAAASRSINHAVDQYIRLTEKDGLNQTQAFEELSQLRFETARIHTRLFLIKAFYERIEKAATPATKAVLTDVASLFALWSLENEGSVFLKAGFLTSEDLDKVTEYTNEYCKKVRDQAIGLTDAFNLSDFFINAPIGLYDGDAYRHYFEKVNRQNPPRADKPPYYQSTMVPFFQRAEEEEIDLSELESDD